MRRLPVLCAGAVIVFAMFAIVQKNVAKVSAAGSGNLQITPGPGQRGCPLGPGITFCDQAPGSPQQNASFSISNTIAVTSVSLSIGAVPGMAANLASTCATAGPCDFVIVSNTCTGNLAAHQVCTVLFGFTPTTTGLRVAAFTVTDSQGDTLSIIVEGTGKNLQLGPAPPSPVGCGSVLPLQDNAFAFCTEPVGAASAPSTFTLTAGAPESGVNVSFLSIPGLTSEFAAGDFTIASTTCTGALATLASCNVNVSFTPTTAGLRSAALTATDASGDSTTIYLIGSAASGLRIGTPLFLSAQGICPNGNQYQLCNEPVGGTSQTIGFTLSNTSGTTVTGITITPPVVNTVTPAPPPVNFTVMSTTCTGTLSANQACTINVAFTPQSTGLQQGEIVVRDDQGDLAGFNLAGIGNDYTLQLASGQTTQLTVAQGGTATFNAQVTPSGTFGANGEKVTFVCPANLPSNTSCAITPCPVSITANTVATFKIVFVTSSETSVAAVPSGGCTSYGPPPTAMVVPGNRPDSGPSDGPRFASGNPLHRGWQFPAPLSAAMLAYATFLTGLFAAAALFFASQSGNPFSGVKTLRRASVIFAAMGLAAVIVAGCGGGKKNPTIVGPATTTGTTTMNIQGVALDANGNSLNASRPLSVTLQVITGP